MEHYQIKIIGPNIDESQKLVAKDNDAAIELALGVVARYPLNTRIFVYKLVDVDGHEFNQYIATVEHVVRRTV